MSAVVHTSKFCPKVFPYKGTALPTEIDRAQELTSTPDLSRDKINELGTVGVVGYVKNIPNVPVTLRQYEYGSMEFFNQLANQALNSTSVEMTDFKTTQVNLAGYVTDEDDTFLFTRWYPNQRLSSFTLNMSAPDALIERTFNFVGEDRIDYQGANKYLIYLTDTMAGGDNETIVIGSGDFANYPTPVVDPNVSNSYFDRITRERSGAVTELTLTTDYTYNSGTKTITILDTEAGDVIKAYYTAGSYITGATPFVSNTSDLAGIRGDCVDIYMGSGNYLYRLQNASIEVTFDRSDIKELGNSEVVARSVNTITTKVTLGRIVETLTIPEILAGQTANYGKIDIREFATDIVFYVYIYANSTKSASDFLLGMKLKDLAPTGVDDSAPVESNLSEGNTLEGEEAIIADNISELTSWT